MRYAVKVFCIYLSIYLHQTSLLLPLRVLPLPLLYSGKTEVCKKLVTLDKSLCKSVAVKTKENNPVASVFQVLSYIYKSEAVLFVETKGAVNS